VSHFCYNLSRLCQLPRLRLDRGAQLHQFGAGGGSKEALIPLAQQAIIFMLINHPV
jgi:hypothetical protein